MIITVENLHKSLRPEVLRNDMEVAEREVVCVIGPQPERVLFYAV